MLQVIPNFDTMHHLYGEKCPCKPYWECEGLLVHRSFDGREAVEMAKNILEQIERKENDTRRN